ncbi:MAG: hypothetical protein H5T73_08730 [Actinobacteria bacterium]|nr:hypothetical protein [Actinomycetota bacterium]
MQKVKIESEEAKLREYVSIQLKDTSIILSQGYATLMGWRGPKRCFVCITNSQIIILWLAKRYSEYQEMDYIDYEDIVAVRYKLGLIIPLIVSKIYNQKPFTPRLRICTTDGNRLSFAFDNQDIAKKIYTELRGRISNS